MAAPPTVLALQIAAIATPNGGFPPVPCCGGQGIALRLYAARDQVAAYDPRAFARHWLSPRR
jgi:hypothetical protein